VGVEVAGGVIGDVLELAVVDGPRALAEQSVEPLGLSVL
jgi:hypothetical protein